MHYHKLDCSKLRNDEVARLREKPPFDGGIELKDH